MSDGYKNGAFALGLVTGVGLSLNLFLWTGYFRRSEDYQIADIGNAVKYNQVSSTWDWLIKTYVEPTDSLAQWFMVLLATITAALLWRTLVSANQTNIAAVKAADAANESNNILRMEQRPWLTLKREIPCHFVWSPVKNSSDAYRMGYRINGNLRWQHDLKNVGKTPAFGYKVFRELHVTSTYYESATSFRKYVDNCKSRYRVGNRNAVFPEHTVEMHPSTQQSMLKLDDTEGDRKEFSLFLVVIYTDQTDKNIFVEARLLSITADSRVQGPCVHKLLEHSECRITE